jgi:DNA-binding MurR/RpiR family transcriptional regulator
MADEHRDRTGSAAEQVALEDKVIAALPQLSKKQKESARFILDSQGFVAFASAHDVGARTNTSAATVVRFCQALGYEGYPHLQAAIRQWFPRAMTRVQKLEERLTSPIPKSDILARVCATDIGNIKHTMELVDPETFEAAVTEIGRATSILVVGEGLSAPPALFFAHSLKVMGFLVQVVTAGGAALSLELSALRPSDLLVGMSFWRYTRETVEAMHWAKETGTRRIAMTDSNVSPLAQLADYAFVASTYGVAHSSSPTAFISLINAFVAALSFRRPQQTLAALRKVDAARKSKLLEE